MLTDEEVRKVLRSIVTISLDNANKIIGSGGIKPIRLDNGYMISLSLDVMRENLRIIHLSVSNGKGKTDVEVAKFMANDILGEGYQMIGPMNVKNVIHFMKVEQENTMIELMKNVGTDKK